MFFDFLSKRPFCTIAARILATLFVVFVVFPIHNMVQARIALRLGDRSQKEHSNMHFSPLKSVNLSGALCMLLFNFGWPELFSINFKYFKGKKKYMYFIELAGDAIYLAFFAVSCAFFKLMTMFTPLCYAYFPDNEVEGMLKLSAGDDMLVLFVGAFFLFVMFDVLFTFIANLIPLPPLGGYRFLRPLFSKGTSDSIKSFEPVTELVLLVLSVTQLTEIAIKPVLCYISINLLELF